MGTRHYQKVISKSGESKVQQYGQWDGYPDGQGVDILKYLREGDLDKYQENLDKIPLVTEEQVDEVNNTEGWSRVYPYLSRDCGSDIHQMIEDDEVKFVQHIDEEEAEKWCEGFYTIDFQKGEFITEWYDKKSVYKLDELPTEEEYLKVMEPEEEEE